MSSKKNQSNIPIISTIIVAAVATALAVAATIMILTSDSSDKTSSQTPVTSSIDTAYLTEQYQEECKEASYALLRQSHEILRLFVTEGLFHEDEPYGNLPEDGYYTVNSTDYTSMQQIEELVYSVYAEDAAQKILKNIDGNGLAVYAVDKVYEKAEKPATAEGTAEPGEQYVTVEKLGISADFTPDPSKSWTNCAITIDYYEEGRCGLTVYLDMTSATAEAVSEADEGSVLEMTMIKLEDGWRLTDFVTRS